MAEVMALWGSNMSGLIYFFLSVSAATNKGVSTQHETLQIYRNTVLLLQQNFWRALFPFP